ncbi:restriction endonuclease subunit S [Xylella fastidiosa]|uniref:restriction endonuclease subunit S n=1 Tax=Xylella fastidiosa TaxID=2371 RepID=UPI000FE350BB|nr:restriction endonuclease subunit S [Xylella fastidiosa]MDD0942627.1 restriction endonuclease subunit S [Xylella fastidiosa subsp. multiplex]MRT35549.1 restriction endonuclease subunit S [Xylella fastidiosa subsp. multiplex]MRT97406.1 restriction endonuclease subunit S [Xylella fastidiosa subsp. multiplex]MRU28119.1 restriction endonuclease subunit S [Xylella fastidiosa subsp. multiplex]MRU32143.1 restriction endonuclease subunit S [Xylella fastidiosa subsp. multiplex]
MSRIDELIAALCPEGVGFKTLGELLDYEQPGKYLVASTAYDNSYWTPVLTAGQTFILGYTDETSGIYPASPQEPVIIFDDFTTAFKWVDFPFKAKSSAMKMLTLKAGALDSLKYVFFAMQMIAYTPQDHARQWIGTYSKFLIPVPPLEVQRQIVKVLDTFTTLEAELEAELEARRRQYQYYRDALLTFEEDTDAATRVRWITLDGIAINLDSQRRPLKKSVREAGEFAYYGASGIIDYVSDYIFDGDYLLVSEDGANLLARSTPIAFSISGKTWVNNHAHVLQFNSYIERRFVEIYLNSIDLSLYVSGAVQPKLNQANLNRIPIPIPPLEVQARIVAVLDQFDTLVNDITAGLPAEIAARRQQYAYYRDRLLTFKEAV